MIEFIEVNTKEGIGLFPLSFLMEYKKGEVIQINRKNYEYFKREFVYHKDPGEKSIFVVVVYVTALD